MEISVPVGNAVFIWDTYSPKRFVVDCIPCEGLRNATKDLWLFNKQHSHLIDYFSPKGKFIVTGYSLKGAQNYYTNWYVHLPGMHHIVWSDINIVDIPVTIPTAKGRIRRLEFKAFVAVSDVVNIGISVFDHFYLNRTFVIKRVPKRSWKSILSSVGLPDPIPVRKPRFTIEEETYKDLVSMRTNFDEELKRSWKHKSFDLYRKYSYLTSKWLHDIISKEIGTYDIEKYTINWRAVGCHPDIAHHFTYMIWDKRDFIWGINKSVERKNYKGRMRVDLNRVLMKKEY